MITRDVYTFAVQAFDVKLSKDKNGEFTTEVTPLTPKVFVKETSLTPTEARKALKAEGYDIKKGCELIIDKVARVKYACTMEDFLSVAHEIEQLTIDGVTE